ncbi:glycosyltransferase [Novosphingobium sp. BL-8A]|uniref:glycosyltransferase n=1 Tax=Novosphingobium sp. BL-8A TaxID=3127639 RepID=UPI003757F880
MAVLLASYNGADWIGEQIQSILRSEGVDCHIFLSDDGSGDDTVNVARCEGGERLTLLPIAPRRSAAQNFIRLVQEAEWDGYDYVSLADQDDRWFPDKLAKAVRAIETHDLAGYSSDVQAFWPDGRRRYIRKSQPLRRFDYLLESAGPGSTFVFPAKAANFLRMQLNKADTETLGGIERHDWLFYAYFREASMPWLIDATAGLDYRQHESNVVGAAAGLRARLARLDLVSNGWYRSQILAVGKLTGASNALLEYLRKPEVKSWGKLLAHSREYRRRLSEACAITLLLMAMAIGKKR